jgi:hypothetical protein
VINSVVDGESLGHAFNRAYEAVTLNFLDSDDHGSNVTRHNWLLIGDPALVIHVPSGPLEQPAHADISLDGRNLTVTGPETWWVRPYPDSILMEWGWYPNTLHAVIGAGTALMTYWGAPGYDHQIPYFVAKYQTLGHVLDITQEPGTSWPLGWGGSFVNNVHVDEHADGTRTYLWRVRLMDFNHENGGIINNAVDAVLYTITPDPANPPGVRYCFGDPGAGTPCPCSNDNDGSVPGSGCANGVFASGAQLTGSGSASVGADTLVLATSGLEPSNSGLYFQADNDLSPGIIWGDGLQCAGGSLKRLGVRFANASGYSDTSAWTTPISVKAGNVLAGNTKHYQCWYRTTVNPPCGAGVNDFNSSNGYAVTWTL